MALTFAGLTIPAAAALNAVAAPRTLAAAGARALVPLVYGQDRQPGLVLNVLLASAGSGTLLVQMLWCHACNAVGTLRLNDKPLSGGSSVTSYTGSQSTADSALVAAFAAQGITYSDTLAGYAYSVISMPVAEFDGQLNFSALIEGRKLYDPRLDSTNGGSGSHRLATPSTWAYSTNPSLALADFLYSNTYGANEAVLWSSVITNANANDALIGSPTETHRMIGVSFTQAAPVPDVAEALRAYAGCWLVPTSGGIKLLGDTTGASVATYSHASGNIAAIDSLALRDLGNSPTVVEVVYTDASQIPYREASAFAQQSGAGTTLPWRLSTVRLPGIQRYGQAVREATERLNKLTLSDLSTVLEVFDEGIAHEVGDIVTVSHPVGLVSKLFRISAPPDMMGPGRWRLPLAEYDPAVYSTAVATGPTYTDAGLAISEAVIDAGVNLLRNSSFEADTNADGLADSWTAYSVGTTGSVTYLRITSGTVIHGTYKQRLSASGLGTGTGDRAGIRQLVSVVSGQEYVFSVWHGNNTASPVLRMYVDWYTVASAFISGSQGGQFSTTGAMQRASWNVTAPATAAQAWVYIWMEANGSGPGLATLDIDAAQFSVGADTIGYVPGDWGTPDLLAGSVNTPILASEAVNKPLVTSRTSTMLHTGSTVSQATNKTADGAAFTTLMDRSRVLAIVPTDIQTTQDTTSTRMVNVIIKLQLIRQSDSAVMQTSTNIRQDKVCTAANGVATFTHLCPAFTFDAVATGTYFVRAVVSTYMTDAAGASASNLTNVYLDADFNSIELRA